MRPRLSIRRIPYLRPFRPPNTLRPFTQNTLNPRSRPQLPFLSSSTRRPVARFLTTERKKWIKDEVWRAGKYTTFLWTCTVLLLVTAFGVQQEWLERKFPSPHEWSWITRKNFRSARWDEDHDDEGNGLIDWARTGEAYRQVLRRLEDPSIDGSALQYPDEGGPLGTGIRMTGLDISSKPESWRRGYYEVLMGAGRAAEHLEGWVRDKTRNVAFPSNTVIGPSNPNPRPVPPGAKSAPKEEDCEPAFEAPEIYYMRVLTTQGFTEKQKVDAALTYGAWLDFKGNSEAALEMYKWALDISKSSSKSLKTIVDTATGIVNTNAGSPSANVLSATTALAVHHAQNSKISIALPIFLSILRARRTLPDVSPNIPSAPTQDQDRRGVFQTLLSLATTALVPPQYPSPPPDGTAPPRRTPQERCEEAGIMTYIGEILYASKSSKTNKEDGLAWTREAVDLAEEELQIKGLNKEGKKICKQCLQVGLGNWAKMVKQLSEQEKLNKKNGKVGGWLGFGGEEQKDVIGRWESEEQVVKDRVRRAREVLGGGNQATAGTSSFLTL